ncbi:MAG: selenide, water dikinase SelD [Bacteroidetes bacterium]|nr:selenide, water dikinase SelD [Bacteroidota bacterium]
MDNILPVYLDYNATTPVDVEVIDAMMPFLDSAFGNPSSSHYYGIQARKAVEQARIQVADLLNCSADEVIFTSGGTESNNLAIKGIANLNKHKGNHIITSAIEHPAVSEVCRYLAKNGFRITYLPVNEYGIVNPADLHKMILPGTILVTIMHANNETGSIQPIGELARICHEHSVPFHTDAAQSVGKIKTDVRELDVDLLSLAGHKMYAPKGVGALYVRRGTNLEKYMHGADHEMNRRAGTENVMEIVGLGKASEIALRDFDKNINHMQQMRDLLHNRLLESIHDIHLNGHPELRLPNTLSIGFRQIEANLLLSEMNRVAASAGAACHTGTEEISPVLKAMNVPALYAMGTVRFSVGKYTTLAEIEKASDEIITAVRKFTPSDNMESRNEVSTDVRLTQLTHGLGCACKLKPQDLEQVLKNMPLPDDAHVLVGLNTSDDAAVYRINETTAIVQTLDFLTPVVDDPYYFGAIAAANSLSDIYAMGGQPRFALSIVAFPSRRLPISILSTILKGAADITKQADVAIIGGHTIEDDEPKFGLAVTGIINIDKIWRNSTAQPGDWIVLTKPLGLGILSTALKKGMVNKATEAKIVQIMCELNRTAFEVCSGYQIHACTDVTGFGLTGHLSEMSRSSKVDATIYYDKVPVISEVWDVIPSNIFPGGAKNNLDFVAPWLDWDNSITLPLQLILSDPQTSGGLLLAVPDPHIDHLIEQLHQKGLHSAAIIGQFNEKGEGKIKVINK